MIVNFTVENFKSINEMLLLNLTAAKRLKLDGTIGVPEYDLSLLPVTGIYGANGSGKSNLVAAIAFMTDHIIGNVVSATPFRYQSAEREENPTAFSILFIDDTGIMYHYGFSVMGSEIVEEWLSAYYTKRETMLFTRTRSDAASGFEYSFGNKFIKATHSGRAYLDFTCQGLDNHRLLLTELAERKGNSIAISIQMWFFFKLIILKPRYINTVSIVKAITNSSFNDSITSILKQMDFDFDGFDILSRRIDLDYVLDTEVLHSDEKERIRREVLNHVEGVWAAGYYRYAVIEKLSDGTLYERRLRIRHKRQDNTTAVLPIEEASSGFKRMLDIVMMLVADERMRNATVVIDEIEQSLHTLISRSFISSFRKNSIEEKLNCQLVFITHDTNLLDLGLLRRDEIQFMEKDSHGASYITNYAEFKVIPGINLEKGYLDGRFGAIPILKNNLWEKDYAKT